MTQVRVAVVPCGGLGTRFLPFTKSVPKEMLPLVDTPVVDAVIAEVVEAGVKEVVVVSAPGKAALDAYFRPNPSLEARLLAEGRHADLARARRGEELAQVTIVHQDRPLGNGDAVLRAREVVGRRPFLMVWGDDLTMARPSVAAQLVAARERLGGGSVAAAMRVPPEELQRYGGIEGEAVDERTWRVRRIVEKPARDEVAGDLASVHGYVFEPEIFDALAEQHPGRGGEIWLTDAVNELARHAVVHAYVFEGERYDAGDRVGYVRAVVAAALARPDLARELRPWLRDLLGSEMPAAAAAEALARPAPADASNR
ncbi:MAG: UTP--glucose-1-phosphate uridylyltransferase [Gemmatimonadetes bacterium]|nr:UTP--glucose-1-phosphate uridylyltransferase [Gemmatimonadota bacterium]